MGSGPQAGPSETRLRVPVPKGAGLGQSSGGSAFAGGFVRGRIRIHGPREGRRGLLLRRAEDRGREFALGKDRPQVSESVVSSVRDEIEVLRGIARVCFRTFCRVGPAVPHLPRIKPKRLELPSKVSGTAGPFSYLIRRQATGSAVPASRRPAGRLGRGPVKGGASRDTHEGGRRAPHSNSCAIMPTG